MVTVGIAVNDDLLTEIAAGVQPVGEADADQQDAEQADAGKAEQAEQQHREDAEDENRQQRQQDQGFRWSRSHGRLVRETVIRDKERARRISPPNKAE